MLVTMGLTGMTHTHTHKQIAFYILIMKVLNVADLKMYIYLFIPVRGTVVTKAPLRVQFLPALGGRGWEWGKAKASSSALLSKKGVGREGSIESQQKFDFFCYDITPYLPHQY